jgi:hypothetical protein
MAGRQLYTGITGTIDGGGAPTRSWSNCRRCHAVHRLYPAHQLSAFSLAPATGTTVTLGDGFASPGTIMADGAGTLDNRTTLSGSGTIIGQSISTATGLVVNDGAIISSITGITPAVSLYMSAFTNNGTISATGNGAAASGA